MCANCAQCLTIIDISLPVQQHQPPSSSYLPYLVITLCRACSIILCLKIANRSDCLQPKPTRVRWTSGLCKRSTLWSAVPLLDKSTTEIFNADCCALTAVTTNIFAIHSVSVSIIDLGRCCYKVALCVQHKTELNNVLWLVEFIGSYIADSCGR